MNIELGKQLLTRPGTAWPRIEQSTQSPAEVMAWHVAPLALLSAVCGFIGMSLVGVGMLGFRVRVPLVSGLLQLVFSVILTLVMIGVLAWLIRWLAPRFGGVADTRQAVKLAGYSATASLLGGVLQVFPPLAMLGLLAGLYSLYLLYLGLPVLMKNRPEETLKYTALVASMAIACAFLMALLMMLGRTLMPGSPAAVIAGDYRLGSTLGQLRFPSPTASRNAAERMEMAAEKVRRANAAGDAGAQQQAMQESLQAASAMLGAQLGGSGDRKADARAAEPSASAEQLASLLPTTLTGLSRKQLKQETVPMLNIGQVKARYEGEGRVIRLEVIHQRMIGQALAYMGELQEETDQGMHVRQHDKENNRFVELETAHDGSHSRMEVTFANGIQITLRGEQVTHDALQAAFAELPLHALETL